MSAKSELDHYHAIVEQEKAVRTAQAEYVTAREECKDCKQAFDKLADELLFLIAEGPDPQEKLDFDKKE